MHCATAKIERENHKAIAEALATCEEAELQELEADADAAYVARIGAGLEHRWFSVYIKQLPTIVELTWGSKLPWPGAPGEVSSDVDVYLVPAVPRAPLANVPFNVGRG